MQQIKNYLSRIKRMDEVLLLPSTGEFRELAGWIASTGAAGHVSVADAAAGGDGMPYVGCGSPGAVIFDYGCGESFLEMARRHGMPDTVIGRMREGADWFPLWEACRQGADSVYIEYCSDNGEREMIEWERGLSGIELSVIVPVYNMAEYLPECIGALTEWKAPYVEYIFVNDGSTDGSEEIILSHAKTDGRIKLINKENGGCASARNAGLKAARGRYIGFADPDDTVDGDMFRKLLRRALMGNYDIAYCGYKEYRSGTGKGTAVPVMNDCLGEPYLSGTYRTDRVRLLAVNTRVAIWRCIYRRELLDRAGISFHEDLRRFDDLPFRVECIFAAGSAACVPEYLYYYRTGRDGQDISCTDRGLFVHFDIFEHLDRYTDAFRDSGLKDLLQVVKLQTHGYGLSRIEKAYRREYMAKAVRQLDRNMGYFRTVLLMLMYGGRGNLLWYTEGKIRDAFFS